MVVFCATASAGAQARPDVRGLDQGARGRFGSAAIRALGTGLSWAHGPANELIDPSLCRYLARDELPERLADYGDCERYHLVHRPLSWLRRRASMLRRPRRRQLLRSVATHVTPAVWRGSCLEALSETTDLQRELELLIAMRVRSGTPLEVRFGDGVQPGAPCRRIFGDEVRFANATSATDTAGFSVDLGYSRLCRVPPMGGRRRCAIAIPRMKCMTGSLPITIVRDRAGLRRRGRHPG
jgi:hypothetical protein